MQLPRKGRKVKVVAVCCVSCNISQKRGSVLVAEGTLSEEMGIQADCLHRTRLDADFKGKKCIDKIMLYLTLSGAQQSEDHDQEE